VLIAVERNGRVVHLAGQSKEISPGGLGAVVIGHLSEDESVSIDLRLSDSGEVLSLRAHVRNNPYQQHFGFEFTDVPDDLLSGLQQVCESLPLS